MRELIPPLLWREHLGAWRHCARCALVKDRLLADDSWGKFPSKVAPAATQGSAAVYNKLLPVEPFPVAIMLPHPDLVQGQTSCIWGDQQANKQDWPLPIRALLNAQKMIGDGNLPYDLKQIPLLLALGCRPINYKDVRKALESPATARAACKPRWEAELLMIDPRIVIAMGHHSFAALFPRTPKKADYTKAIGEVLSFAVAPAGGPSVTYCAYIAPSPQDVAEKARAQEWSEAFTFERPIEANRFGVQALRWHLYRAMWLGFAAEHAYNHKCLPTMPPQWVRMLEASNQYHDQKARIVESVRAVEEDLRRMTAQELSANDVMRVMTQRGSGTNAEEVRPSTLGRLASQGGYDEEDENIEDLLPTQEDDDEPEGEDR